MSGRFHRQAAIEASIDRRHPRRRQHCTGCGKPVAPPRSSWCSKACVDAYLDLKDAGRARRRLAAQDPHCALCRHPVWVTFLAGDLGYEPVPEAERRNGDSERPIGFRLVYEFGWHYVRAARRTTERLCELDHIVPLVEGGEHEWSNLRLLCLDCHKSETAALAARLARRRRSEPKPTPPGQLVLDPGVRLQAPATHPTHRAGLGLGLVLGASDSPSEAEAPLSTREGQP